MKKHLNKVQLTTSTSFVGNIEGIHPFGFGEYVNKLEGISCLGNWKDGQMDGFSRIQSPNGEVFLGEMKANIGREGLGKSTENKGEEVYVGNYSYNKRSGMGLLKKGNGSYEYGMFSKGKLDGLAVSSNKVTGVKTCSEFRDGVPDEYLMISPLDHEDSQDSFHGKVSLGQYDGLSRLCLNSTIYEGGYSLGLKDGFGRYYGDQDNTGEYLGEFREGKKQGSGILTIENSRYRGGFHEDKYSGLGHLKMSNYEYLGDFRDNQENGFGYMKEGTCFYIGDWKNGLPHGLGYQKTESEEYKGFFEKGERMGRGMFKVNSEEDFFPVEISATEIVEVDELSKNLMKQIEYLNPDVFYLRQISTFDSMQLRLEAKQEKQMKELAEDLMNFKESLQDLVTDVEEMKRSWEDLYEVFKKKEIKFRRKAIRELEITHFEDYAPSVDHIFNHIGSHFLGLMVNNEEPQFLQQRRVSKQILGSVFHHDLTEYQKILGQRSRMKHQIDFKPFNLHDSIREGERTDHHNSNGKEVYSGFDTLEKPEEFNYEEHKSIKLEEVQIEKLNQDTEDLMNQIANLEEDTEEGAGSEDNLSSEADRFDSGKQTAKPSPVKDKVDKRVIDQWFMEEYKQPEKMIWKQPTKAKVRPTTRVPGSAKYRHVSPARNYSSRKDRAGYKEQEEKPDSPNYEVNQYSNTNDIRSNKNGDESITNRRLKFLDTSQNSIPSKTDTSCSKMRSTRKLNSPNSSIRNIPLKNNRQTLNIRRHLEVILKNKTPKKRRTKKKADVMRIGSEFPSPNTTAYNKQKSRKRNRSQNIVN